MSVWAVALVGLAALSVFGAASPKTGAEKALRKDLVAEEAAAEAEYRIRVENWNYSRERKTITGSNRVTLMFTLANRGKEALANVRVEIELLSELGQPIGQRFVENAGGLAVGATQQIKQVQQFVPAFGSYRIEAVYRSPDASDGGKEIRERWRGIAAEAQPQPESAKLAEGRAQVAVIGQDANLDGWKRLNGQVCVRNQGDQEATDLKITVEFLGPPKKGAEAAVLSAWTEKLNPAKLAGGAEKNFPFQSPKPAPPGWASWRIRVACAEMAGERAMGGGAFRNVNDVECAYFDFKRAANRELNVSCRLRNGKELPVSGLSVTLRFFKKKGEKREEVGKFVYAADGELKSTAEKALTFTLKEVPDFDAFEHELAFVEAMNPAENAPITSPAIKKPKFTEAQEVEALLDEFLDRDDGLAVLAKVRNGRAQDVQKVVVRVRFLRADGSELTTAVKELPGTLAPGEIRNFVIQAKGAKGHAHYESDVRYVEIMKVKTKVPDDKDPESRP